MIGYSSNSVRRLSAILAHKSTTINIEFFAEFWQYEKSCLYIHLLIFTSSKSPRNVCWLADGELYRLCIRMNRVFQSFGVLGDSYVDERYIEPGVN